MALKKRKGGTPLFEQPFDKRKFVSHEAKKKYNQFLVEDKKDDIEERAIGESEGWMDSEIYRT